MEVYSIGFTKRSARDFFEALRAAHIEQILDVRLRNESQLAGYAKRDDLAYFLKELLAAGYLHEPLLAPSPDLLDAYRKRRVNWAEYEETFLSLMKTREVETRLSPSLLNTRTALLCSEYEPDRCHRRLVLEYLRDKWSAQNIEIVHL